MVAPISASYDTIDREALWGIMAQFAFPYKLIRLLKATLEGVTCCVKVQNTLSSYFESLVGLRQGDELSTKLFNIGLEGVIRRAGIESSGTIITKSVQLLAYADDIDIVARNIRSLTDAYARLEKEANKIGLHVNIDKTKLLMICPSQRTQALVGAHLNIEDKKFEVVKDFPYLGSLVDENFNTSLEVKRRIVTANRAFYGVKHLLISKNINRHAKFQIYKTLIRPVAIYGAETWNTTTSDEEQLAVFERKVLRSIIGPVKDDNCYRRRFNYELYQVYQEPDIVKMVQHRRLSWAGHVIRRDEGDRLKQLMQGNFRDGRRKPGRQKISWRASVDKDGEAFGLQCWRKAAMDRSRFSSTLNAVMARTRADDQ